MKRHAKDQFSVSDDRTQNVDRLIKVCTDHGFCLVNTISIKKATAAHLAHSVFTASESLIILSSATGGVHQSRIANHSGGHPCTYIIHWPMLAFVCPEPVVTTITTFSVHLTLDNSQRLQSKSEL